MVITGICRQRRSLYRLILDGQEGPTVDAAYWDTLPYRAGDEITPAQLEAAVAGANLSRGREKALYLLGLRDYAAKELERKLSQDVGADAARQTVERLTEVGLLDDERFARNLARSLREYKQYPRSRILQELLRRGVARVIAENAVEDSETDDLQQALAILRKKYYNKCQDRDSRQKVMAALARRGFGYATVRRAMEEIGADPGDEVDTWQ